MELTPTSWLKLISEVGPDLARWPNEKAFTSWLGLSPGKAQSGKRQRRARHRPKTSAGRSSGWPPRAWAGAAIWPWGGFHRRLKARTNAAVATVATARKLAVLFYKAMHHGLAYVEHDLGAYEQAYRERQRRYLDKCAGELGPTLVPTQPQST